MDFGWPNVEIGRKMANGQLLFLALVCAVCVYMRTCVCVRACEQIKHIHILNLMDCIGLYWLVSQ